MSWASIRAQEMHNRLPACPVHQDGVAAFAMMAAVQQESHWELSDDSIKMKLWAS